MRESGYLPAALFHFTSQLEGYKSYVKGKEFIRTRPKKS